MPRKRKSFDAEYETVYVKQDDDGNWFVAKANHHPMQYFGPGEGGKRRAEGHAHGLAHDVITLD